MPPDPGAVDAALIARLTDPALQALMPGGVYFDIGAKGQTAMVIVSVMEDAADYMFHGDATRRTVYQVKAVDLQTSGARVTEAAARIHALLQWDDDGPPPLVLAEFDLLALRLVERVRYTEVDTANADQRWQHHGGLYEVLVAPVALAPAHTTEEDAHGTTTRQ